MTQTKLKTFRARTCHGIRRGTYNESLFPPWTKSQNYEINSGSQLFNLFREKKKNRIVRCRLRIQRKKSEFRDANRMEGRKVPVLSFIS